MENAQQMIAFILDLYIKVWCLHRDLPVSCVVLHVPSWPPPKRQCPVHPICLMDCYHAHGSVPALGSPTALLTHFFLVKRRSGCIVELEGPFPSPATSSVAGLSLHRHFAFSSRAPLVFLSWRSSQVWDLIAQSDYSISSLCLTTPSRCSITLLGVCSLE